MQFPFQAENKNTSSHETFLTVKPILLLALHLQQPNEN